MYIIHSSASKLKFIKKLLESKGLHVEDTILTDYILTVRDPRQFIPEQYKTSLTINKFNQSYVHILKNSGVINKMFKSEGKFELGSPVKIVSGEYEGFTGLVVGNEDKSCVVEISVWGKIIKETIKCSELELYESPFR